MSSLFTQKIRRAFSAAAAGYDAAAGLQRDIGHELIEQLPAHALGRLLDVGCGTGALLAEVGRRLDVREATGADVSEGMLAAARQRGLDKTRWIQADARALPFGTGTMDAVMSNLAYQWVDDLDAAFSEARRVLVPGGTFAATVFGAGTCWELREALRAVCPRAFLQELPSADAVETAFLRGGFADPRVTRRHRTCPFSSVRDLLHWLKTIGANTLGGPDFFLGRERLARLEAYCRRRHPLPEGIGVSFEVILLKGQKA